MTTLNSLVAYAGLQPILDVESSTSPSTYTLPTGANIQAGQRVKVANVAANSGNYPIVSVNASDATLVRQVYPLTDAEFVALQANPTNQAHWLALGTVTSNWIPFTGCTVNGNSNAVAFTNQTNFSARYLRNGDTARIRVDITFQGAPAGGTGSFGMLIYNGTGSFLRWDSTKLSGSAPSDVVGICDCHLAGANKGVGSVIQANNFGGNGFGSYIVELAAGEVGATSPFTIASGDSLSYDFVIPITGWSATRG